MRKRAEKGLEMQYLYVIATVCGVLIPFFWVYQLNSLMMMRDHQLCANYDKVVWGFLFVFIAPIAPFLFIIWKKSMLHALQKDYSR